MRKFITALAFAVVSATALAGETFSVEHTDIGTLMANPQARAVLQKYLPKTLSNEQFSMASGFTLVFIQGFDQTGELTDENLKKIDAELAAL